MATYMHSGDPEGYGDPVFHLPNVTLGLQWFEQFRGEATPMTIPAGSLVLVEVHGLPDNQVKEFTYRASYEVQAGQQVLVPAPDWSIRVTGRAELPGFVLGVSEQNLSIEGPIRNIIAQPAYPRDGGVTDLIKAWDAEATQAENDSFAAYERARQYEERGSEIRERINQLRRATGGN